MAQILGQLTRYKPSPGFNPQQLAEELKVSRPPDEEDASSSVSSNQMATRRPGRRASGTRGRRGRRSRLYDSKEIYLPQDMKTFGTKSSQDPSDVFEPSGHLWAHHCCAAWSSGVCQTDSYDLENVDKAAVCAFFTVC